MLGCRVRHVSVDESQRPAGIRGLGFEHDRVARERDRLALAGPQNDRIRHRRSL